MRCPGGATYSGSYSKLWLARYDTKRALLGDFGQLVSCRGRAVSKQSGFSTLPASTERGARALGVSVLDHIFLVSCFRGRLTWLVKKHAVTVKKKKGAKWGV